MGSPAHAGKERVFLPLVDGWIQDQIPFFDGVGDEGGIEEDQGITVDLNSGILDGRGVMEFDLRSIKRHRIRSAFLKIVPIGRGFLPGTSIIPVQLIGYQGDGFLQPDDFNVGCFITVFDSLAAPFNVPIYLDVTKFLRRVHRGFLGFSLRTNVHGAQVNFGSLEIGSPPTLIVTVK